jgi:hypothetical protein
MQKYERNALTFVISSGLKRHINLDENRKKERKLFKH